MSFFDPCISVLVGGWRNGESVLFRFLCKLIAGLIDFSWPRPSPSPWRSLPDGGSHAEGAEYSGSEWEAGQEVGARWGRGAGGTAGPQLAPTRHDVTRPQTLWSRSHLTVCWVLRVWGPVFFKSFFMRVALSPCALSLPKLASGLSAGLVGDETARVLLRWGGVLFFSKLPLTFVCPVLLSPSRLPSAALGPRPTSPQPPRPEFLESTFAIFVFALRRVFRFISCFICKSCLWFCFVLFPSFSEKIVAAFLSLGFKKGFREVVWGRRVVRHTGKSEGCVLL